jgi:murein DD-endopeptidase MepM/ murein hydrolase activator NlpD
VKLVMALAASLALATLAAGQEAAVPQEVAKARQDVRALEDRLKNLEQLQANLGHQREKLELELQVAALRVREAELEKREAEKAADAAAKAAEASQAELEQAIERLRLQLALLTVLGRAGLAPLVVHAFGSGKDIPQRVTTALALFREEKRRRDEAALLMARREATLAALSARREEVEDAAARVAARRQELERTKQRVETQLAGLEHERRTGAMQLAGAQEAEERLERLWGVVTQGDTFSGADIRLLRGGLRWPVEPPRIEQRFGAHRDPHYGTVTVSHGLTLSATPGANVVAVASGKVSYAQFFKGYGNLVIVHHGGDIYSLYAGLASMFVHAGERVGMGDALGSVGRGEAGSGSVYLEIRVGQNAEDPVTWLRPIER